MKAKARYPQREQGNELDTMYFPQLVEQDRRILIDQTDLIKTKYLPHWHRGHASSTSRLEQCQPVHRQRESADLDVDSDQVDFGASKFALTKINKSFETR